MLYVGTQHVRVFAIVQNDSVFRIGRQIVQLCTHMPFRIAVGAVFDQRGSPLGGVLKFASTRADQAAYDPGHARGGVFLANDPADVVTSRDYKVRQRGGGIEAVAVLFVKNLGAFSGVDLEFWGLLFHFSVIFRYIVIYNI